MTTWSMNGVHGTTGTYLAPPGSVRSSPEPRLQARAEKLARGVRGLPFDSDPLVPEQAGWAVVAHESEAAILRDALQPLFTHRERTLGDRTRFLEYQGQSRARWLAGLGAADSDVDPSRVPYYLLLAGSAAAMPFELAHDLAVDYAVGRLELDSFDEYRGYAERLVAHEEAAQPPPTARRVAFFGPRHHLVNDVTWLSAEHLLKPLAAADPRTVERRNGFESSADIGAAATKSRLVSILAESDGVRPALLFTASHGVAFDRDHPFQRERQGALLCQDWTTLGVIDEDCYFAAADVPENADLTGLVSFHFACYSAGTPQRDRFFREDPDQPTTTLAEPPFVAALAKALLRRGALAVIGHVDRAWGYSVASPETGRRQLQPFENFLGNVLAGRPVGYAMRDFADRYARFSTDLTTLLERREFETVAEDEIIQLWTQRNDAGSYIVIGDPLARLRPPVQRAKG